MKKIVLGTWSISGDYGYKNEINSRELLNSCVRKGILEFDTAPNYGFGYAEYLLGDTLKNNQKVLFNTKVGNNHFKEKNFQIKMIEKSFFKSLKNLGSINILFLHNPRDDLNLTKVLDFLVDLKKNKLINNYGISLARDFNYKKEFIKKFKFFQVDYSLLNFNEPFLKLKRNIYGRSPFASGLLANNISLKTLKKNDNRKKWLTKKRLLTINKKKNYIIKYSGKDLKKNSIQFVKCSNFLNKIIIGLRNKSQLNNFENLYFKKNDINFDMLKDKINLYDKSEYNKGY